MLYKAHQTESSFKFIRLRFHPERLNKNELFFLFTLFIFLVSACHSANAQSSYQELSIDYDQDQFTILAIDASLKNVLLKIAQKRDAYISYPDDLEQNITIKLNEVSFKEALHRLLRDFNHIIIYSGPSKSQAVISEVYVISKKKIFRRFSGAQRRIARQISAYEKRIESLKSNLSRVNANSRRHSSYLNQIRRLENNIERLQRRLH
jgi:hypothetical protein